MNINDPVGDLLTRIRNGHKAKKAFVLAPVSSMRESLLNVLLEEGYIRGISRAPDTQGREQLKVELKYADGLPVIQMIKRISTPGRRVYSGIKKLKPVFNHLGINILSTSQGVMSDAKARKLNLGGEVLCSVF